MPLILLILFYVLQYRGVMGVLCQLESRQTMEIYSLLMLPRLVTGKIVYTKILKVFLFVWIHLRIVGLRCSQNST